MVASMVPGSHPLAEVEAALLRATLDVPDGLEPNLPAEPSGCSAPGAAAGSR